MQVSILLLPILSDERIGLFGNGIDGGGGEKGVFGGCWVARNHGKQVIEATSRPRIVITC